MKKIILTILSFTILGCNNTYNPTNVLQEESKLNINLNKYNNNFVVKIGTYGSNNYTKPNISINENEKGFLHINDDTIFISKSVPTDILFNLDIKPTALYLKIDNNGNGLAISKPSGSSPTGISQQDVFAITIKNYQPQSTYTKKDKENHYFKSNIITTIPERDSHKVFNYLSDFRIDEKGNGLLLYSHWNYKYKNKENLDLFSPIKQDISIDTKVSFDNKTYTIEIKDFKILKEIKKITNTLEYVQKIKKDNDSYFVVGIPIIMNNYGELTNKPNIDDNGNGSITWYERFISENSDYYKYKIFIQKVVNYKPIGDKVELLELKRNSLHSKIDSNGNGIIIYTDSDAPFKIWGGKLYFSEVKNFKIVSTEIISNSEDCVNPAFDMTSKGNGLIVWQDGTTLYGRRLENFKMK